MTWRTAFSNLAAVSVAGVATSYDLDDLPNMLPSADLPALAPAFPDQVGVLSEDQGGLSTLTYDGSAWTAALVIDHVLYWTPGWSESGLSVVLPDLIDAVDEYLEALRADGTLGGALASELAITRVMPGVVEYAGIKYYGVRFRHVWRRVVAGE